MPEYLAPGVYVEEVSFRSKSIEGVPTSTTGFAGLCRWGPVCYAGGPLACEPRLITSFTEFERVYGGLDPFSVATGPGTSLRRLPYLAHAAKAFADNGGKRLYVCRVFAEDANHANPGGVASRQVAVTGTANATWRARWPGALGNVHLATTVQRSKDLAFTQDGSRQVRQARFGDVVEVLAAADPLPAAGDALVEGRLRVVERNPDGSQRFVQADGSAPALALDAQVLLLRLTVTVSADDGRVDVYEDLGADGRLVRDVARILERDDPEDQDAMVWLDWDGGPGGDEFMPARLIQALVSNPNPRLQDGHDGALAFSDDLAGQPSDPDDATVKATGLAALGEIEDIAIVALPDAGTYANTQDCQDAAGVLIGHAERLRYRIAIVDAPRASSLNEVREFRANFDSTHAALYHPWIEVPDPNQRRTQGAPPQLLALPPSGFMAGIYARNDTQRGVHKAPANEVIRGISRFESNITHPRNEVLNPEGINALRFFEGRGYRVWGARTLSSDPEWKYVNVRRLFIYVEHSIDRGTQWAVFEPNGPRLWANVRRAVEDFLLVLWRDGALLGDKPEQAYFVRCDRTTMTQNDLDNGRLICLVGIAPVRPAEFVIFRIGQWTADAEVS
jgi:phage tail sheath protein FI